MTKQQKKQIKNMRPEVQKEFLKLAKNGINFNKTISERLPINMGLFNEVINPNQVNLF